MRTASRANSVRVATDTVGSGNATARMSLDVRSATGTATRQRAAVLARLSPGDRLCSSISPQSCLQPAAADDYLQSQGEVERRSGERWSNARGLWARLDRPVGSASGSRSSAAASTCRSDLPTQRDERPRALFQRRRWYQLTGRPKSGRSRTSVKQGRSFNWAVAVGRGARGQGSGHPGGRVG